MIFSAALSEPVENKSKHRMLNSYRALNGGNNNKRTLIGTAERWPLKVARGYFWERGCSFLSQVLGK